LQSGDEEDGAVHPGAIVGPAMEAGLVAGGFAFALSFVAPTILPAMGMPGAAVGTVAAHPVAFTVFATYVFTWPAMRRYATVKSGIERLRIRRSGTFSTLGRATPFTLA